MEREEAEIQPIDEVTPEQLALVEAWANKPWSTTIYFEDETNQYVSHIPELNIAGVGDTRTEALASSENSLRSWLFVITSLFGEDGVEQYVEKISTDSIES